MRGRGTAAAARATERRAALRGRRRRRAQRRCLLATAGSGASAAAASRSQSRQRWRRQPMCAARDDRHCDPPCPPPLYFDSRPHSCAPQPRRTCSARPSTARGGQARGVRRAQLPRRGGLVEPAPAPTDGAIPLPPPDARHCIARRAESRSRRRRLRAVRSLAAHCQQPRRGLGH